MDATQVKETAQEQLHTAEARVRESIEHNPGTAVLTAFGIGLGVGVVVGAAIAEASFAPKRSRGSMEEFGRNVFQAASKFVPDFH